MLFTFLVSPPLPLHIVPTNPQPNSTRYLEEGCVENSSQTNYIRMCTVIMLFWCSTIVCIEISLKITFKIENSKYIF